MDPIVGPLVGAVIGIVLYDFFIVDVLHARLLNAPPTITPPAPPEYPIPPARPVPEAETIQPAEVNGERSEDTRHKA